ncbi:unnamed protein product [Rhodiola kirilowii]
MEASSPLSYHCPPPSSDKKSNQADPHAWTWIPQSLVPHPVFQINFITFSTFLISFSAAAPTSFAATDSPKSGLNTIVLIITVTVSSIIAVFVMLWLGCFRFRSNTRKNRVVNEDVERPKSEEEEEVKVRQLSWDEVNILTNGFEKVIDSGGFSVVYYGTLPFNPKFSSAVGAAFKVQNSSERLNQVFKEELSILLKLNHPNIVKLYAYCDDQEQGALVFEYVEKTTLQKNLKSLEWCTRVSIAYQLALALEYLHEQCELHVVHGDIKASNILLDSCFNVKLCDFGSAKMGFSAGLAPSRKHLITGSPGYVDPHYLRTGISSKKNDIYSFGVVLMELLTGLEPFCNETGRMLASRVVNGSGHVDQELVDRRLGGEYDLEEWRVMGEIAATCVRGSPSLRPSASEIICSMRQNVGVEFV